MHELLWTTDVCIATIYVCMVIVVLGSIGLAVVNYLINFIVSFIVLWYRLYKGTYIPRKKRRKYNEKMED